jgi:hypothetical protein
MRGIKLVVKALAVLFLLASAVYVILDPAALTFQHILFGGGSGYLIYLLYYRKGREDIAARDD